MLPPMTNMLVLSIDEKTDDEGTDFLEVAVDVTYIPQLFKDALKPTDAVWGELAKGGFEHLKSWLQKTPVVNLEEPHTTFKCTLLYSAARFGNLEAVKLLVDRCAQVDSKISSAGSTALHTACFENNPRVVKFLLDSLADTTLLNGFGKTALDEAKPECKSEFAKHNPLGAPAAGTRATPRGGMTSAKLVPSLCRMASARIFCIMSASIWMNAPLTTMRFWRRCGSNSIGRG